MQRVRRAQRLRLVGRLDHDRPRREDERGLRAEARAGDGHVDRAGAVAAGERARRANVEQRGSVGRLGDVHERRRSPDERAAVQLDDLRHVRRSRRLRAGGGGEKLVVILEQRVVEAPLEADRRRRLRAHRGAAERSGDMARIDLDAVAELGQPAQAVEEPLGARDRLDGEIGPRGVADEQRVAGEHEPRLRAARAVDDGERAVLRPVTGRVDRPDDDVAELDLCPVHERLVRVRGRGRLVHPHRQTVLERQPSVPGDVVGVRVRLEHADERERRGARPPPGTARSGTTGRRGPRCRRARHPRGTRSSRGRRRRTGGRARRDGTSECGAVE